jgi:peptide-methionine (R)-S-oxide reductase
MRPAVCRRIAAQLCAVALLSTRAPTSAAKSRDIYPIQQIAGRDWIDVLSSGQYFILRQGGTEPPNSSPLVSEKRRGVYVCAGCVAPLFDSTQKFDSGTGWPSFAQARTGVEVLAGLLSSEVRCGKCGGHLGDVFNDGARFAGTRAAETGRRFCIDGAALVFVPSEGVAPPVAGDGLTGRARLLPQPARTPRVSEEEALRLRGGAVPSVRRHPPPLLSTRPSRCRTSAVHLCASYCPGEGANSPLR